jgi:leucyl-tRNA synthetase
MNFKKIEEKWQKKWENAKAFEAKEGKGKKYYVLEMYPYPSGSGLHMGHAFNYTIGDILARFMRMKGYNVLYPMGYDSFGLPAENAAIKAGTHPKKYTDNAISNFIKQQKALGLSYDWNRILMSHDPEYYKWNQHFFLEFLRKGLVYRKKAGVNWCPKCNTVLANEQVHGGKCWRHSDTDIEIKNLEQWFVRTTNYAEELLSEIDKLEWPERIKIMQKNWIGKSEGTEIIFKINSEPWHIFTTRPDTLFGVTFMVISAQHPRLMEIVSKERKKDVESFLRRVKSTSEKDVLEKEGVFTGSYVEHPLTKEKIPVWAGNFVVADYGSGMIMAVPAHDIRDFEFAKKYKIHVKQVIAKNAPARSYLMGAEKISDDELNKIGVKVFEKLNDGDRKLEIPQESLKQYEKLISDKLTPGFWNEYVSKETVFLFKHKNKKVDRYVLSDKTEKTIDKLAAEFNKQEWKDMLDRKNVWSWLADNSWYMDLIAHQDEGVLINSEGFDGLLSGEAKEHITKALEENGLGKKVIQYKLRDWLISRQRYWGTPIPIIYCDNCGIVPVPEKDLPIKLPEKVKFGNGNPLESAKDWINVKCPKCKKSARRETDTMDTFMDSSWYYLRFTDSKNKKNPFDKKSVMYWTPIDQYIGGAEHATMHLIYARFFTKALRDLGYLRLNEPFNKLFNQGMLHKDGFVMSKSRGNVVSPEDISKKYGIDTARLFLMSIASPDKDTEWTDSGIEGSFRFVMRVINYFDKVKIGESSAKLQHKVNSTIKKISEEIPEFKYNNAVINLRSMFDLIEQEGKISRKDLESFVKMFGLFCPHISEELWEKLGNKKMLCLEKWPPYDEKKIDKKFDEADKILDKTVSDIIMVLNLVKEKKGKEAEKVYLYVIPNELYLYDSDLIEKRTGKKIEIYAVNDKKKYDPENKSGKAKPGRPSLYIE